MASVTVEELVDKAMINAKLPRTWENKTYAGVIWTSLVMKTDVDKVVPLKRLEALKSYDDKKLIGDLLYLVDQSTGERLHKELIKAMTYELSTRECASQYPELFI